MSKHDEQIKYNNWCQELAPEHSDYWSHVSLIADLLGYMLEARSFGHSGDTRRASTIVVHQAKEKFGDARVYVSLADDVLVARQWDERNVVKWPENEGSPGRATPEFIEHCRLRDIKHYNSAYTSLIRLLPQYADIIRNAADHYYATFDDAAAVAAAMRTAAVHIAHMSRDYVTRWACSQVTRALDIMRDLAWDTSILPSAEELVEIASQNTKQET